MKRRRLLAARNGPIADSVVERRLGTAHVRRKTQRLPSPRLEVSKSQVTPELRLWEAARHTCHALQAKLHRSSFLALVSCSASALLYGAHNRQGGTQCGMSAYTTIRMDQAHHENWFISQNDVCVSLLRLGEPSSHNLCLVTRLSFLVRQLHRLLRAMSHSDNASPLSATSSCSTTETPLHCSAATPAGCGCHYKFTIVHAT